MKNYYYLQLLKFIDNQFEYNVSRKYFPEQRIRIFNTIENVLKYSFFYINVINRKEYDYIYNKLINFLEYTNY